MCRTCFHDYTAVGLTNWTTITQNYIFPSNKVCNILLSSKCGAKVSFARRCVSHKYTSNILALLGFGLCPKWVKHFGENLEFSLKSYLCVTVVIFTQQNNKDETTSWIKWQRRGSGPNWIHLTHRLLLGTCRKAPSLLLYNFRMVTRRSERCCSVERVSCCFFGGLGSGTYLWHPGAGPFCGAGAPGPPVTGGSSAGPSPQEGSSCLSGAGPNML